MPNMTMTQKKVWDTISQCIHCTVSSLDIRVFVFKGKIERSDTPFQITFSNSLILTLESDSDGESLRATNVPWIDPFARQQSAENQSFVDQQGKWILVPCLHEPEFAEILGESVDNAFPIFNQFDKLCGVLFVFSKRTLAFFVEFDECKVEWNINKEILEFKGLKLNNINHFNF